MIVNTALESVSVYSAFRVVKLRWIKRSTAGVHSTQPLACRDLGFVVRHSFLGAESATTTVRPQSNSHARVYITSRWCASARLRAPRAKAVV